jgi:hypothetical protein
MAATHINQLAKYFEQLKRYPKRKRGLCIGDSWFQYPLRSYADLQRRIALPSEFGNKINFIDDSYPGRDADEVFGLFKRWRRLAATLQQDYKPFDVVLLSLGGNDVIGLDFEHHLKLPGETGNPPWPWSNPVPPIVNDHIRLGVLTDTFRSISAAYQLIIDMRDDFAPNATIIAHTYADVTPSKTGYEFLTFKTGPWIWKPASKVGLKAAEQKEIVRWLLESFHELLLGVQEGTSRFVVLDTRMELPDKSLWDNEIHPLGPGFRHLVEQYWRPAIAAAIA